MSAKEVSKRVAEIEAQAATVLDEARAKAKAILLQTREEATQIIDSVGNLSDTEAECESIKQKAIAEAKSKSKHSEEEASKIKISANAKIDGIVKSITSIIAGEKP